MLKKLFLVLVVVLVVFGVSGCISIKKEGATTSNLGGAFVTDDRFETWKHRSQLMTPGETPGSIANTDIYFMRFDPSDEKALYAGTREDGLYYSYNSGAGWMKSEKLPAGFVRDTVVDPKDKCTIYSAVNNKVYKSEDCARTWARVFHSDNNANVVTSLDVDWFDSNIIWAGMSDGTLMKSMNKGTSWEKNNKFVKRVNKIVIDPNDSRVVYVGVIGTGLFKTENKGEDWVDLNKAMKDFKNSKNYYDFVVSTSSKGVILYGSKFGIIRSLDGGVTWAEVKLLTQAGTEIIYSMAIDPSNANYIYYGTDKAMYKSIDGGSSWVVKNMPTTRVAGEIMVHPKNGSVVYVGVKSIE